MADTDIFTNRASVARSITASLGASKALDSLAAGLLQPGDYMPENEGQYWQFRRYMHDILCLGLIDNGTFRKQEFTIAKVDAITNNMKLNRQKPDLYTLTDDGIHLGEVSLTYNIDSELKRKSGKYNELLEFLGEQGHQTRLDVILLDLTDPEWRESFSSISSLFLDMLQDFIDCLRAIHANPKFGSVRAQELGMYNTSRMQYVLEEDTVVDQVFEATGIREDYKDILPKLDGQGKDQMSDELYIEKIASSILNSKPQARPTPDPRAIDPITMKNEFRELFSSPPTTKKLPKILQLGCPSVFKEHSQTFEDTCTKLRSTGFSGGYLDHVKQSLTHQKPEDFDRLLHLQLSTEQLEKEQLEGPGRKAYLRKHGLKIPREAPRHIGVDPSHQVMMQDFISQIEQETRVEQLTELRDPSVQSAGISLATEIDYINTKLAGSSTTGLLRFYQSLSNEIVINSMRRRKNGEYVLGYSGFSDVYFLIAPGPQLRTESSVEFTKIISLTSPMSSGFSATWHAIGDHWESSWLSVDVDRLKQWQRCFDRVSVSVLANAERLVRPGTTMRQALSQEMSAGNYTLLALTYLEDKQLTSVTNQNIRYLWMKSLGDKQFERLASKFPSRVNSIIQSTMLQRAVASCEIICKTHLTDLVKVNKLHRDDETGLYDETTTGVVNLLPRLFTYGGQVPISYNLNEIYWCMAYNKDRQNAAQDSLRIMEKIVKEESKYDKEIAIREGSEKVNYFLGHTSVEEDIKHAHSICPESHYYSSRGVRIGVRLQDKHQENMADNGSWMTSEKLERILSKPLSEYATFKASVKDIAHHINPNDLADLKKIGVRTKAIELVAEILENEKLMTASEIVMQYSGQGNKAFQILIQIFKKGQIGGVREIIILYIKARIMMNVVEEVARLLCKSDKREILTKGRDKRLMMRGDYEEVTSSFPAGTPLQIVKESYDMTVWCQKFIPVIFTQIHRHHFKDHPGMHALATHIFLAHSNKKIEYPRKMVEQWEHHRDVKHTDPAMQAIKEKFFVDGKPYLVNHSNMCQGIPHYNSSVLGLSCISLRDALFKECLQQLGIECAIKWKTRLGSDDKGTIIGVDLSKPSSKFQLMIFGQCERVSERLHCMELSIKSASGHVMYELNSAYMANLETMSPTIKFSLASTDTIETTSCTTFVNESYARIRQMRENGCSSLICLFAHLQNATHFDRIFGTGMGDVNDVATIFGQKRSEIPYDFGIYPIYDADLQDVIGPEFYNYRILKQCGTNNPALKMLYTSLSVRDQEEMFQREEDELLKKDHFGIQQGIVKQLSGMRERTHSKAEEVEEYFTRNPFLIVRGPETPLETLMMVRSKLFTKGAAQSLRRTSPAIYIGRLAAYRSAKAWSVTRAYKSGFDIEKEEDVMSIETTKVTYSGYLKMGLVKIKDKEPVDVKSLMQVLYPNHRSLDIVEQLVGKFGALKSTDKKFSQAVRTWTVNNFNYEFTSGLRAILQTSFSITQESSKEDVEEFKKLIGMKLESLDGFVEECKSRGIRPLDMFFYLTKLHKASKSTRVQSFAYGPTTQSLHMTAMSLKKYNHMPGMVAILDDGYTNDLLTWSNTMASKIDRVKLMHNLILMRETGRFTRMDSSDIECDHSGMSLSDEVRTIIRGIKSIAGFDFTTQKAVKLVAAYLLGESEFRDKLIDWKDLNFTYLKRQKKTVSKSGKISWSGDLEVLVSSGNECFVISEHYGRRKIVAKNITDPHQFYRSLQSMCRTLGMELQSFFKRRPMSLGDVYLSDSSRSLHISEAVTASANVLNLQINKSFRYKRIVDLVDFRIVKSFDSKFQVLTVHLEGMNGKTATVCHSRGVYYPVEIPSDLTFSSGLFYQGVRMNSIVKNSDWFFNRRLPPMSESETVAFLRNDVDFGTVLGLEASDMTRITDYMEVRDEVNEESFPIMHQIATEKIREEDDGFVFNESTMFQTFERAMTAEVEKRSMDAFNVGVDSWADMVETEMEGTLGLGLEDDEENVIVTKAFGYKKPKQQKAAYAISNLMQGSEMRTRVLDSFFRLSSVKAESVRTLPGYIVWCSRMVREGMLSEPLADALTNHMLTAISERTGVKKSVLKFTITQHPHRVIETPLRPLYLLIHTEQDAVTQEEFLDDLYKLSEDYQDEISDTDSLY